MSSPEQEQDPSTFNDNTSEAAWGDTPKAMNTDWSLSELRDASQPGGLVFSEH